MTPIASYPVVRSYTYAAPGLGVAVAAASYRHGVSRASSSGSDSRPRQIPRPCRGTESLTFTGGSSISNLERKGPAPLPERAIDSLHSSPRLATY